MRRTCSWNVRPTLGQRQLAQNVAHAPAGRTDEQFIAPALDDQFDVPAALGQLRRDTHSLGIAVLEEFGVGHK